MLAEGAFGMLVI